MLWVKSGKFVKVWGKLSENDHSGKKAERAAHFVNCSLIIRYRRCVRIGRHGDTEAEGPVGRETYWGGLY